MNCGCNLPAKLVTVKKEGPNKGRKFYACSKPQGEQCDFFCWEGETPRAVKQRAAGEREALEAKVLASMNNKLDQILQILTSMDVRRVEPQPKVNTPVKDLPF